MIVVRPFNVATFFCVSEKFCDAYDLLMNETPHRVHLCGLNRLIALMDGGPIPKTMKPASNRIPKGGYKETRFAYSGLRVVRWQSCDDGPCPRGAAAKKINQP